MGRQAGFGTKLRKEATILLVKLAFIVAALWPGFLVLPDVLTAVFLDAMDLPGPSTAS